VSDGRFSGLPARELPGGTTVILAKTRRSRRRGLGGLASMPADQGLEIPTQSVHMFTMKFALDLIWLGKDGSVVRVDRDVRWGRMRTCLRARSVIEVSAGGADAFLRELAAERNAP
jgi:uncharacterized membrane protein (UPF0127 family)